MPLNLGYIEGTCADGDVAVRIYYDATQPAGPDQPLINGPRGWCLDMTNVSGRQARVVVTGVGGQPIDIRIGQGDPVTSGPPSGRSRTAAQMASLGFTTRGSVGNFALECD
jgi:hypothetical protein